MYTHNIHVYPHDMHAHTNTHFNIHTCTSTQLYTHARTHTHTHIHTHTYTRSHLRTHLQEHTHTCTHKHTNAHPCKHIHTGTHTILPANHTTCVELSLLKHDQLLHHFYTKNNTSTNTIKENKTAYRSFWTTTNTSRTILPCTDDWQTKCLPNSCRPRSLNMKNIIIKSR